jgi:two-component system response regulator GlrR
MRPFLAIADKAFDARAMKPHVALVTECANEPACASMLAALDTAFACSVHRASTPWSAGPLDDAQLAIWNAAPSHDFGPRALAALEDAPLACPLIMIANPSDAAALERMIEADAADFVFRPFNVDELVFRARRVLMRSHRTPGRRLGVLDVLDVALDDIVTGTSPALAKEIAKVRRYAACDAGVLILGETGTGKEVFAKAIHNASKRAGHPLVALNCGAVPTELMEAELFGHVKGAYTGAHISRTGLVSEAEGGTLFLDDVDCVSLSAQAKLLRFLQEREYRVVGSNTVRRANVRVVAASNRDLAELARRSSFRQDLFYRLNVLPIDLPPLRERKEDIGALARHFLHQFSLRDERPECRLCAAALNKLMRHDWPGNVRELGHVLERAVLLAPGQVLMASDIDLPDPVQDAIERESFQSMKARVVESFERGYLENVLRSTNGNIANAARAAGKNRRALFQLIRKHNIAPESFREAIR